MVTKICKSLFLKFFFLTEFEAKVRAHVDVYTFAGGDGGGMKMFGLVAVEFLVKDDFAME